MSRIVIFCLAELQFNGEVRGRHGSQVLLQHAGPIMGLITGPQRICQLFFTGVAFSLR